MRRMRRVLTRVLLAAALLAAPSLAAAQEASSDAARIAQLEAQVARYLRILADWAGLTRYGSEDAELKPPAPGTTRVVFIGDDVTEQWGKGAAAFFPGREYLNRGISRQTTGQMLVRFRQDVIALQPAAVVISGGLNDVAGIGGPGTRGTVLDNLMSMTELAQAHGIKVVLASITPICDCSRAQTAIRSQVRIADFNEAIREYAGKVGAVYLDYYGALAEGRNLRPELTADGLLPNDAGYAVMAPLAERAIQQALGRQ